MRPSRSTPPGRRVTALLVGALIMAGGFLASSPAAAHDQLLSSDPETGSTLPDPPDTVTLTYSADVAREFVEAAVATPGQPLVPLAAGDIGGDGAEVVLDLTDTGAGSPAGEWSVVVRIVSADGHPVESVIEFRAGAGTSTAQPDASSTAPAPPAGATPDATADATPDADPSVDLVGRSLTADDDGQALGASSLMLAVGILALVIVLAGGLVAFARRR